MTRPPAPLSPAERRALDASREVHRHRWEPTAGATPRPRGVYLLHGTGEHAARYDRLARRLTEEGFPVGAHDHPGHGRSGGPRGRVPVPGLFATRAAIECLRFAHETGSMPYLFGHSLGGVVAAELALLHRLPVAGLILSAPAIVVQLSVRDALKLRTMTALAPRRAIELAYDPTRLTHDETLRRTALADPWIHGFKSAEFINWLIAAGQRLVDVDDTLDIDTLLLIAGDDRLIDTSRTHRFAERIPAHRLTRHVYDGAHHELLNEVPDIRDRVTDDIVGWLNGREDDGESSATGPA